MLAESADAFADALGVALEADAPTVVAAPITREVPRLL
jgi:hypothetical protein